MANILIIEDEATLRSSIRQSLALDGHTVRDAGCIRDAWEESRVAEFDAVVTDINLVGESGLELVKRLREDGFDGAILVMTAYGSVGSAVEAMKLGADDYLQKPISLDELALQINLALDQRRTSSRLKLYERLEKVRSSEQLVLGESPAWRRTLDLARKFASIPIPSATTSGAELPTILLQGETGTGKGVVAHIIHRSDPRFDEARPAPFVHVNCAALPASLIESELFGHEKGAFTDAKAARAGLFEMAEGGTIFLDEIGEMPLEMQAKLLIVVEKGVFRRIGGSKERSVRAKIIAATNQDLGERVKEGRFRRDLLYRLNALTVDIPALRERTGDCLLIARELLERFGRQNGKSGLRFDTAAENAIRNHTWPGNVRELTNAVKRAAILSEPPLVTTMDLGLGRTSPSTGSPMSMPVTPAAAELVATDGHLPSVDDMEKALILSALKQAHGNVSQAAKLIGLNRGALRYRIERLGIEADIHEEAM